MERFDRLRLVRRYRNRHGRIVKSVAFEIRERIICELVRNVLNVVVRTPDLQRGERRK